MDNIFKEMILSLSDNHNLSKNLTPELLKSISENNEVLEFILIETNINEKIIKSLLRDRRKNLGLNQYLNYEFEKNIVFQKLQNNICLSNIQYIFEEIPIDIILKDNNWIIDVLKCPNFSMNYLSNNLLLEFKKKKYFENILKENNQALSNSNLTINFNKSDLNWMMIDLKLDNYYSLNLENRVEVTLLAKLLEKIESIHNSNTWHLYVSDFVKIPFQLKLINFIVSSIENAEKLKYKFSEPEKYNYLNKQNYKEAIISIGGCFSEVMTVDDCVNVIKKRMFILKDFDIVDFKNKTLYDLLVNNMDKKMVASVPVLYEIIKQYNSAVQPYINNPQFRINLKMVESIGYILSDFIIENKKDMKFFLENWMNHTSKTTIDNYFVPEKSQDFNRDMLRLEILLFDSILNNEAPKSHNKNKINKF